MKTRLLILIATCVLLTGCSPIWIERRQPTTEAERTAVLAHAEKILAATPHTLAGHDQDWDDAIVAAHSEAIQVVCPLTYWEYERDAGGGHFTGRFRYAEEIK